MSVETVAEKIRKLLALAACEGASDAEKTAALHQASRLAEKHAIDLDALGSDASEFGSSVIWSGNFQPPYMTAVLSIVESHFNVKCFRTSVDRWTAAATGIDRITWSVFGCLASRDVAEYVFTFLSREFVRAAKQLRLKQTVGVFRSMASGLSTKLESLKKTQSSEEQSNSLILSNRLKSEFEPFSTGFGTVSHRPTDASRVAYDHGKTIEICPALKGVEQPLAIGMRGDS